MSTESPPAGAQKTDGAPEHAESAAAPSPAAAAETMGANDQRGSASAEQWKLVQHVLLTPEELPELRRRGQPHS